MSKPKIDLVLLPGDGVGPEIIAAAQAVLSAVERRFQISVETDSRLIGGAAIEAHGTPLRAEDLERCNLADAVLLGAVGGPKWDDPKATVRPEQGLLRLRKGMGLFANLRPVAVMASLVDRAPIKPELLTGVDMMVVRELTGGVYFGRPRKSWRERRGRAALDTLIYREYEVERISRLAFEIARDRKGKLASVDKANVLDTSRLWRSVVTEMAPEYPDVELEHVLVDSMTMHLIREPARFDVIVTENMFGDILTDEASVLAGSIGMLPSASIGAPRSGSDSRRRGVYEPIHGSAPTIAGKGLANPVGTILSLAMLFRISLQRDDVGSAIETAVSTVINSGKRTPDIADIDSTVVSTGELGSAIAQAI
ncbi:MAG TPA: 3-isopropylmalate dehydrogenase [Thermomicrobiales bacterium]|nr:3-isopropylmalate dehydrogenase [Thermomicrobiales bacterium]